MPHQIKRACMGFFLACSNPWIAQASETITYIYDARGRIVQVDHTGSVNNGVRSTNSYDQAGNRTGATLSGSGK